MFYKNFNENVLIESTVARLFFMWENAFTVNCKNVYFV